MRLFDLSIKALTRRKTKALLLILAIAVSVATVTSMLSVSVSMRSRIDKELESFGANLAVMPKTSSLSLSAGSLTLGSLSVGSNELLERDIANIRTIEDNGSIAVVSPKLFIQADVQDKDVILAGVDFPSEKVLKRYLEVDGRWPQREDEVLLGQEPKRILEKSVGSTISMFNRTVTVVGEIKESGSQDDYLIFTDLKLLQSLTGKIGRLTLVDVRGFCNTCPIEKMASEMNEIFKDRAIAARAVPVRQVARAEMNILDQMNGFSTIILAIVLTIGVLGTSGAMMSSINERKNEIGVMRAIGYNQWDIASIFLLEALIVGALAGLTGFAVGSAMGIFMGPLLANTPVSVQPSLVPASLTLGLVVCGLASIYPSWRAANTLPSITLRSL